MSGVWIKREADLHQCDTPSHGESLDKPASVGDEWRCFCGDVWTIISVDYGDQRDPIPQGYIVSWSRND